MNETLKMAFNFVMRLVLNDIISNLTSDSAAVGHVLMYRTYVVRVSTVA